MQRRNIEIKAVVNDLEPFRQLLLPLGAVFQGTDLQVDTYFEVPHGRLKLREGDLEKALIYYQRPNQKAPKLAQVMLVNLTETTPLKTLLSAAFRVKVIVTKRREIYFLDNLKIHLDQVDGLGRFVEIEALGTEHTSEAILREQCQALIQKLNLHQAEFCADSYSDMLLKISPP
jgi:predicted adenylyl cyclase CyaB